MGLTHVTSGATMGMTFVLGAMRVGRLPPGPGRRRLGRRRPGARVPWLAPRGGSPPRHKAPAASKWPVPIGNHLTFGIVAAVADERLHARSR